MEAVGTRLVVVVNHLGYDRSGPKSAIVAAPVGAVVGVVRIETVAGAVVPLGVRAGQPQTVDGWRGAAYHRVDLTGLDEPGTYRVVAVVDGVEVFSDAFVVAEHRIPSLVVSDITAYFRSQRSSGRSSGRMRTPASMTTTPAARWMRGEAGSMRRGTTASSSAT
ncbi:cellulase N-terminal Ig-like domain-containing protein [Leifsonia poae]|uniref:cellulase N-terminal Ig-like domain-containing protein n=1 Tax=Leifsonia poae TaxID=110933 RepID=UPI003D67EEEA